ncbi:hypothetical protein AB0F72_27600 [Actinoplanes sp. NPDC023936]|uniref:hypothetical protein n=1 Tax=Actinoplanes sp. NPDC023936 TaxID=3154910 RepID=UPI0033CEC336
MMTSDNGTEADQAGVGSPDQRRSVLLDRIEKRRSAIDRYLRKVRPRSARLGLVGVVASTVSAGLVAGPAVGGESFSNLVQEVFHLPKESVVWQALCLTALIVSIVAAVASNLLRSEDLVARVSAAEAAAAELEGLATMLEFETVDVPTGVKLYQQYTSTVAFVDEPAGVPG